MSTAVTSLAMRENAPITIHNHPAAVEVHNHLPETTVSVDAVMPEQPAAIVNVSVDPTPVTLEATIEAHATPAQIIVQHPASARQTVERDDQNEIAATITTYSYENAQ